MTPSWALRSLATEAHERRASAPMYDDDPDALAAQLATAVALHDGQMQAMLADVAGCVWAEGDEVPD